MLVLGGAGGGVRVGIGAKVGVGGASGVGGELAVLVVSVVLV
jgi:hypothetical protein